MKITKKIIKIVLLLLVCYYPTLSMAQSSGSNGGVSAEVNTQSSSSNEFLTEAQYNTPDSYEFILKAATSVGFLPDANTSVQSFIKFGKIQLQNGNTKLAEKVADQLLDECNSQSQLEFRAAGLELLRYIKGSSFTKDLIKEFENTNYNYRKSVLAVASKRTSESDVDKWLKVFKKTDFDGQVLIAHHLGGEQNEDVLEKLIIPGLASGSLKVKLATIGAMEKQQATLAVPLLLEKLATAQNEEEIAAIKSTFMSLITTENLGLLMGNLSRSSSQSKVVIIEVLSNIKATSQFSAVVDLLNDNNQLVKSAVFKALPSLASESTISILVDLLKSSKNQKHIKYIQNALISIVIHGSEGIKRTLLNEHTRLADKNLLIPVFPAIGNKEALNLLAKHLDEGDLKTKYTSLDALSIWKTNDAIPHIFTVIENTANKEVKSKAITYYLNQVLHSTHTDDQKLLLTRKIIEANPTTVQKKEVLKAASEIKTFLSFVFVEDFINRPFMRETAAHAIVKLALPNEGQYNGLTGDFVRKVVTRCARYLTGPESEKLKGQVQKYLEEMPRERGFTSIFTGYDLAGWEGLVKNPVARKKMSSYQLRKAQEKANDQMYKDWFVYNGVIKFRGQGYNNICTVKDYGDFEMFVDWKITNGGDSGIYLRGTPQVQIWDPARTDVGAQVGSGGLYNNQKNRSTPLVVADNPINDWNTFRIKMVSNRVTVYLNGILVTDNIPLENYWDREAPIFKREAIELQAHGENLGFRNIWVREIPSGDAKLTQEELEEGFESLFNGDDLDKWIGNKKDYIVENGEIAVKPKNGGHGNLYTANEYSDFNFRFEFKLTPGANNGLGIHAPTKGDAAYVGKELQILDNTAEKYANLKPYQYHGSVYGIVPAKRGFLKPVGEWNSQEVIYKDNHIKIILNGEVIVDANLEEATKNGTLDGKNHPGLKKKKGHIGFLGHGSELWFRNIRIKDLTK